MNVIIAEDDAISRRLLVALLRAWGHEPLVATDGEVALSLLEAQPGPVLAILDWMMPACDGIEVCRRLRAHPRLRGSYVIMLTARTGRADIVEGLDAGADDFLGKPFDRLELRARLNAGMRVLGLQAELEGRLAELSQALGAVRRLQGLLPICCGCKRIRDEKDYWQQVEEYVQDRSDVAFTHGICPDCMASQLAAID